MSVAKAVASLVATHATVLAAFAADQHFAERRTFAVRGCGDR